MLIGIDASRANHEQKTGVEWYAWHLIEELKKTLPDSVQVILYTDKPLVGPLAKLPGHWREKVLRWPPERLWTQVRLSWEMLTNRPDVLFVPAHVVPFVHPKKTVMTVHDVAAVRFREAYNRFERWYSLRAARTAAGSLWRVIVPSEFTKKELLAVADRAKGANVRVVHHGFDPNYATAHDPEEAERVLKKYGLHSPYLMSLGRLEEKKNTARLVEAYGKFRDRSKKRYQLLLVGKPGHGYHKVRCVINTSVYRSDIVEPGWVDESDVPVLLQNAAVFVYPSLYEGFGLPILEAFAAKTPVVASSGNCLEEIGGDAALYADPKSAEDISKKIESILNKPDTAELLVRKARARAQQFSWRQCAQKTADILLDAG